MRYPNLEAYANGRPLEDIEITITLPRPTTRRRIRQTRVRFDRVTDDMIEAFAYGECVALAVVMQRLSGWPLVNVLLRDGLWNHAGVRRPDGRFVDVYGARTEREVLTFGTCSQYASPWLEETDVFWLLANGCLPDSPTLLDPAWGTLGEEVLAALAERLVSGVLSAEAERMAA